MSMPQIRWAFRILLCLHLLMILCQEKHNVWAAVTTKNTRILIESFSRGFGLRPKLCQPSGNSRRTRVKPLVPRVCIKRSKGISDGLVKQWIVENTANSLQYRGMVLLGKRWCSVTSTKVAETTKNTKVKWNKQMWNGTAIKLVPRVLSLEVETVDVV